MTQEEKDLVFTDLCARLPYHVKCKVFGEPIEFSGGKDIPCWSLPALLDIFPCSKESPIVNLTRGGWNPNFTRRWFVTWEDENKNILYSCDGTSPIDTVVELIMKLHKQKLL